MGILKIKTLNNRHKKGKIPFKLLVPVLIVLVAATVGGALALKRQQDPENANPVADVALKPEEPKIDLSPPTDEDKQAVDQHKEDLGNQQSTPPAPDTIKTVTPVITDATDLGSTVEVRSYVPGIVEEGGTCTLTLSKGSVQITAQSTGIDNVSQTICSPFTVDQSQLSTGSWTVSVSYKSTKAAGTSNQSKQVEVK